MVLIASELTTNAITHAPGDTVSVSVLLSERHVWVVVVDQGPRKLIQPGPGADDEHGRGLYIVQALASRYAAQPAGDGTAVWACVQLPESAERTGSPRQPAEDDSDVPRSHP